MQYIVIVSRANQRLIDPYRPCIGLFHDSAVNKDATCHAQPVGHSVISLYRLIEVGDWYVFFSAHRIIKKCYLWNPLKR
jgi:hypothetical protein